MCVAVDDEALDLVEHGRVGLIRVHAVDTARRDDADRRLLREHGAHLDGRGMRAQEKPLAFRIRREEERVVGLARRVPGREVQPGEIVVVGLDVRSFGDGEAHIREDHHQLFPHAADGMDSPRGGGIWPDGQRDVDAVRRKLLSERRRLKLGLPCFERGRNAVFDDVDGGAEAPALLVGHGAKLLHQLGNLALLAKG